MPSEPHGYGKPLTGVRVLNLAQQLPGPYASSLLAEMGAEVVMLEQPGGGDPARRSPAVFSVLNRGKSSVVLDLKTVEGQSRALDLVATSRIVLEGFRPGVAARLGVDYESVRRVRDDVVYCSISAHGQTSIESAWPAHDLSAQARAGLVDVASFDAADTGLPLADLVAGTFAAMMTSTAALEGPTSRYLDLSMADGLAAWAGIVHASDWAGAPNPFRGTADPGYGIYRTQDGWLALSIVFEDHFWRGLCHELGLPHLADLDVDARRADEVDVRAQIAAVVARKSTEEWLGLLGAARLPVAPVNAPREVRLDPLLRRRGVIRSEGDDLEVRSPLSQFDADPVTAQAPRPGADNRRLLANPSSDDTIPVATSKETT